MLAVTIASTAARLSRTTGEGTIVSSIVYQPRMRVQSVSAKLRARACSAAIAAWAKYGPMTRWRAARSSSTRPFAIAS